MIGIPDAGCDVLGPGNPRGLTQGSNMINRHWGAIGHTTYDLDLLLRLPGPSPYRLYFYYMAIA